MKITTNQKSVTIATCAYENTYPINALSYQKTANEINLLHENALVANAIIGDITVDGSQLTADNAHALLSAIFRSHHCCCESGSSTDGYKLPYSKAEYSDPLVFPMPICSGHVVDFFKKGEVYRSYQWDGWNWNMMAAKPNLILCGNNSSYYFGTSQPIFTNEVEDKYFITLEDKYFEGSNITTENIEMASKDYTLDAVNITQTKRSNAIVLPPMIAKNVIISYTNYPIDKIEVRDSEINYLVLSEYWKNNDNEQAIPNTANINIINNTATNGMGSITIGGDPEKQNEVKLKLKIQENKNFTTLNINSIKNKAVIDSFEANFDEHLAQVSFFNCFITPNGLDGLVDALISTPKGISERAISYVEMSIELSDDQKTALTNAGWIIY